MSILSSAFSFSLFVYLIGGALCGVCLLVIGVKNPIHTILLLIRAFFLGTLLLFVRQREYFARLFLIVYVGAIVVLFLFIIRRLELKRVNVAIRFSDLFSFRHLIFGFFLLESLFLLSQDFFDLSYFRVQISDFESIYTRSLVEVNGFIDWSQLLQRTDHLRALGGILFTEYKVTIILASLLLFVSRVGAIAVTLHLSADTTSKGVFSLTQLPSIKVQDLNLQARRNVTTSRVSSRG